MTRHASVPRVTQYKQEVGSGALFDSLSWEVERILVERLFEGRLWHESWFSGGLVCTQDYRDGGQMWL